MIRLINRKTLAKETGDNAELRAWQFLKKKGYKLVQRNYQCRLGEIDLICRDKTTLVFIEVRARKNAQYGSAAESVTLSKQQKIIATAQHFLQQEKYDACGLPAIRFDVIGFTADQVEWITNAF